MVEAIIIICATGIILSLVYEKNIFNPLFVFSSIWLLVFILYRANPYDLPVVDQKTIFCMLLAIISFMIGVIFLGNIRVCSSRIMWIKPNPGYYVEEYKNDFFNQNGVIVLQIIGSLVYFYLGISGVKALLSGNTLVYIRYYLRLSILETGINGILISYVAAPIMYFSITYTAANIAIHNINKKIRFSLFTSTFMLVMDLLTVGGRMGILFTMVAVFISFFVYVKKDKQNNQKTCVKFAFTIVIILGIYLMWTMAASRGGNALKDTVTYLYAPVSCFDRYRKIFESNQYNFTYGLLSLQGFTRPIFKILGLSQIGIIQNVDRVYELIDSEIWLNTQRFNSETTFIGYFFFDGGMFAVCVLSLLFGFITQKYYKKTIQSECLNTSSLCLYIIMTGTVALSFIQFSFASIGFAMSVIWILIMSSKKLVFR